MLKFILISVLFLIQTNNSSAQSVVLNFENALDSAYYSDNLADEQFYIELSADLLNEIEVDKPYYQAQYYHTLSYILSFRGQETEIEVDETIDKCHELLKNYQDSIFVYDVMFYKAKLLIERRDYNGAFRTFLKIMNIVRKKNISEEEVEDYQSLEADCLSEIAYVHYAVHADEKAIEYYNKAQVLYQKIGNSEMMKFNNLYTGISYLELEDFENVKKCIDIGDDIGEVFTTDMDIADFMMLKSSYFLEKGEIDTANYFLIQAKAIYKEIQDAFGLVTCNINTAKIAILNNEKNKAKLILEKSYRQLKNTPDRKALMKVQQLLADLNFEFGNYQKAYIMVNEAKEIQQEILKNAQVFFSYEVENKIELNEFYYRDSLNKIKYNQVQYKLKQQSLQNRLYMTVILAFLVLTLILIFLIRRNNKVNSTLNHALNENQVLSKEVHHRVKNNFQITSSILNLQIMNSEDKKFNRLLRETQHRIISMSSVHELLYKSDKMNEINIKKYIEELASSIVDSFSNDSIDIDLKVETNDIFLNLEQSIPIGLILNEAITNSVKYAFPQRKEGLIEVELKQLSPKELVLSIRDNGIGMNYEEIKKMETLGLELIEILVEQISGEKKISNNNGTEIEIKFKA